MFRMVQCLQYLYQNISPQHQPVENSKIQPQNRKIFYRTGEISKRINIKNKCFIATDKQFHIYCCVMSAEYR